MDEGKYQIRNDQTVQGQNVGDQANIHQYFYGATPSSSLPPPPSSAWTIPFVRNRFFLGQDDVLTQLHRQLTTGATTALTQIQAISGLGGIGKTQMAVEYAYRYRETYPFVFWIRAEHRETLMTDLVSLASVLHLPEQNDPDQMKGVAAVKQWLATHQDWLLIFDNADDLSLLPPFLPEQHHGAILLTTRASQTQPLAEPVTVEQMSEQVGATFLLHRARVLRPDQPLTEAAPAAQQAAGQICQLVGGLPLALDQAGAYIDETQCTVQDYLTFYQQDQQVRARLLELRGKVIAGHPEPVATTWALAFARVEQDSVAAADLLRACAFLAPDLIPETLLRQDAHYWGASLGNVTGDSFQWNETVRELLKYSLVRRSREHQALSIHRLVQVVIRDQMDEQNRQQWTQRAVRAINAAFPKVEHQTWPQCDRLLPHALLCAELIAQEQMTFPEAARLLNQTGYYLHDRARYAEAEPLYQHALTIRKQQLRPDHPDTASSLNNLAALYYNQGKYGQAEPLYQRALEIHEQQLGPDHPNTASSLNNLAELYRNQGKYEQAEPLYLRALAIREQQLGPLHPDTATSFNNLAALYRDQGKYEQAKPLYQRALTIRERALGPQHPHTQTIRANYAHLLRTMGRDAEAAALDQP